jgi:uncharacterized membrane protein
MPTSRLEAFSDGVFAIAITLLVLEIKVPVGHGHDLWHALGQQWPSYAGFITSFITIGIIWVNHHGLFDSVQQADRPLLFLNLFLLMSVAFIPFTTALMAEYLREPQGQDVATAVYSASLLLMGWGFLSLSVYLHRRDHLVQAELSDADRLELMVRGTTGWVAYLLAVGVAFVNAYASLVICFLVAVAYIPGRWLGRFRT